MEVIIAICCVLLDVLSCGHAYYLLKQNKIQLPIFYIVFPIALPFLGYVLLFLLKPSEQVIDSKVPTFEEESESWLEMDSLKKMSRVETSYEYVEEILPLEEALILQNKEISRWTLMEIVSRAPAKFIDLLFLARKDKDIEVVHYATTLIAEISRQYDMRLQLLEKKYQQAPTDYKVLTEYCVVLSSYLQKKLVTKRLEILLRKDYAELLEKKIQQKEQFSDYLAVIENALLLKEYDRAKKALDKVFQKWQQREEIYMLYLKYYYETRQGERVKELVKAITEDSIYISKANQERIAFWQS